METEVSALRLAFEVNNDWFEYSTIVVLAGLVFELVMLLAFHKTGSWREKVVLIAGTLIIAIGVAGEWHFGSKSSTTALRLQAISDEKVAALNTRSEELRAANLKQEERIALLSKEIVETRKGVAARNISPEQHEAVVKKLAGFKDQRVELSIYPVTFETEFFAGQFGTMLFAAGWKVDLPAKRLTTPPLTWGTGTWIRATGDKQSQDAGGALFEAMKETSAPSSLNPEPLDASAGPRVEVFVGSQSQPLRSWVAPIPQAAPAK
jgi:hypothetical protein